MEWKEYFQLYDSLDEKKYEDEKTLCSHDYIFDKVLICCKCGEMSSDTIYQEVLEAKNKKNFHVYHRKSYFLNRLYLMNRTLQCNKEEYNIVLDILREENFNNVKDLRNVMKYLKLSSYYKYIYSILYELKGIKLFQFNLDQIESMLRTFLQIERNFKEIYPQKKNLFNYNLLIFYVFHIHQIDCNYDSIIFPQNKNKLVKCINELL